MSLWHIWPFSWYMRRKAIRLIAQGMIPWLNTPDRKWFTLKVK